MKRSILLGFAAVAIAAAGALANVIEHVERAVVAATHWAFDSVVDFCTKLLVGPADVTEQAEVTERKGLNAAQRFVLRLTKRERPVIRSEWRMVPSI